MIKAGIVGGSGLTGRELIKIFAKHGKVKIMYVTSLEYPGVEVTKIFPELAGKIQGAFADASKADIYKGIDVAFLCLPHAAAMEFVAKFAEKKIKVIDLSADFRIKDAESYKAWYNKEHEHKDLLKQAVYGLPEFYRKDIKKTKILANPGCYPTSILLGVIPALKNLEVQSIIVDSKSSVSGAGITPAPGNHYLYVNENVTPYKVGRKHRHLAEVEDVIYREFTGKPDIIFTPQVVPMQSGILSCIYMKLKTWQDADSVKKMYADFYKNEPFVRMTDAANVHNVQGTNFCEIYVDGVKESNTLIVITTIDNLVKGASGQAVQNMNIMFGIDEKEGLQ